MADDLAEIQNEQTLDDGCQSMQHVFDPDDRDPLGMDVLDRANKRLTFTFG